MITSLCKSVYFISNYVASTAIEKFESELVTLFSFLSELVTYSVLFVIFEDIIEEN